MELSLPDLLPEDTSFRLVITKPMGKPPHSHEEAQGNPQSCVSVS